MVFSELALGYLTNLIYDSSKKIPKEISDTYSKVYDKAIEEFSNKHYKLNGMQIDVFFRQKNVETAIEKYLKNPDKLDCSNILIQEFFELFSEEDFSREDADLILNTFFEILDTEIEEHPELRDYLHLYLTKQIFQEVQKINKRLNSENEKYVSLSSQKESDTDFDELIKKYLNKIIEDKNGTEISEVYTELSAKDILPVTLKFRDEENDKTQEFEIFELVEKEEKLIISGESGSGKTTTLRWLNYILAKSYLEGKYENIPLYIELNSYIGEERFIKKSFDTYIAMKAEERGITKDTLKTMLKGKAIILLDGFDLLSPTDDFYPYDKISNFITNYNKCRFVISSRPGFFESIKGSFRVSELEKLTDEKVELFINRYVSDKELANTLKDKILTNQQLNSILSNPMMLYIAIKVAMGRKNKSGDLLPSNRSELYEAFVSTLFSHQEKKGKLLHADRVQIENALTDLYFNLQCRNEVSRKYSEALKFIKKSSEDPVFREISPQVIVEDCFKLGLLNKNNNYVSYEIHQSFQEYYAAIKLKELFENGIGVSEAFSHPKWEEVIIFTSEILDCVDEFIDLMISKGELFLASKCISKASDETKEKLCGFLADKMDSRYKLEKRNSIESLSNIGTAGISMIVEALKDKDKDIRWCAAWALGNIRSETAVQYLIDALKDEKEDVRRSAAEALGNIRSETVVQPLINALKDEDEDVRESAIVSLAIIKSETAVQPLINVLNDKYEDENIRWTAGWALGNIESETAVQPLIKALKDENEFVRQRAERTLGKIKPKNLVQPLINALKDEDKNVRRKTAEALGNIKSEAAVQPLINMLNDENEDKDVRSSAARALGNVKSEATVNPLISALKNKEPFVRHSVVVSLGHIKSEIAVKPLINTLKDNYPFVRWNAAWALGNIKSEAAVQPLINSLKDEDRIVRWSAAEALGNVGSEMSVKPLINALKDEDENVRESAAEALGKIRSEIAVQSLINLLKDENPHVRSNAADALGNIRSETAIEPLINLLKDEDQWVQSCAAEALKNICTAKNKKQLEDLLKLDHEFSVNTAFEILYKIEKEERSKIILFKDEKFLKN